MYTTPKMGLKIISGAQTGVDRSALDVAIQLKMQYGGWIPKGRLSESGAIPANYKGMQETKSASYKPRTEWNVRDSNATLIVCWGEPSGGTKLTIGYALKWDRPYFVANLLNVTEPLPSTLAWMQGVDDLLTLNVAGPRKSKHPLRDMEGETRSFLKRLLFLYKQS